MNESDEKEPKAQTFVTFEPALPASNALPGPVDPAFCWPFLSHCRPRLLGGHFPELESGIPRLLQNILWLPIRNLDDPPISSACSPTFTFQKPYPPAAGLSAALLSSLCWDFSAAWNDVLPLQSSSPDPLLLCNPVQVLPCPRAMILPDSTGLASSPQTPWGSPSGPRTGHSKEKGHSPCHGKALSSL